MQPPAPPEDDGLGAPGALGALARQEFEAFFRRHHVELARLAYSLTGDHGEADDIAGDALASAWQHWSRVQAADHPPAYVRKIVINLSAHRTRRIVRERRGFALVGHMTRWSHPEPDIPVALELRDAVLRLPPRRRACVVLRHVLDLSEDEVARTLGVTVGTVKSQTARGLAQLRQLVSRPTEAEGEPREHRGR
jgi:RNA polymerase sigma-70 factor (sigma-E family)